MGTLDVMGSEVIMSKDHEHDVAGSEPELFPLAIDEVQALLRAGFTLEGEPDSLDLLQESLELLLFDLPLEVACATDWVQIDMPLGGQVLAAPEDGRVRLECLAELWHHQHLVQAVGGGGLLYPSVLVSGSAQPPQPPPSIKSNPLESVQRLHGRNQAPTLISVVEPNMLDAQGVAQLFRAVCVVVVPALGAVGVAPTAPARPPTTDRRQRLVFLPAGCRPGSCLDDDEAGWVLDPESDPRLHGDPELERD